MARPGQRSPRVGGYVRIYKPGHPNAYKDGYILEHRYVLYEAGISIPAGAHVHHKNGDKADNRLENLEVLTTRAHALHHIEERGGYVTNQSGRFPLRAAKRRGTA